MSAAAVSSPTSPAPAAPAAAGSGGTLAEATVAEATVPVVTVAYGVAGMSCGHCSAAVTEALSALPGVSEVRIDLAGKRAVVDSAAPLEIAAVRDAVEGAGYQLV